jgi:hypothetical protein
MDIYALWWKTILSTIVCMTCIILQTHIAIANHQYAYTNIFQELDFSLFFPIVLSILLRLRILIIPVISSNFLTGMNILNNLKFKKTKSITDVENFGKFHREIRDDRWDIYWPVTKQDKPTTYTTYNIQHQENTTWIFTMKWREIPCIFKLFLCLLIRGTALSGLWVAKHYILFI